MAIRDWGEDESAEEPKQKKELGPGFWVALLIVLILSPWLGQIPTKIREFREEQARKIPDVCAREEEWLAGARIREAAELVEPDVELEPGEVAGFRAPARELRPGWPEMGDFNGETSRLKLRGFALSIPHPLDPLTPSRASVEELVFLDPETLKPVPKLISQLESTERPFAPEAKDVCTATRWHPRIHLLFEKLESKTQIGADAIFDERTGAEVSGAHAPLIAHSAKGVIVGRGLGIWHDTPLRIALDVHDGEPEWFRIEGLPTMPNGRDIEDLFEVRIPRVRFWERSDGPDARLDVIRAATELRGPGEYWPIWRSESEGWNPAEFHDVSIRELVEKRGKKKPFAFDEEQMALWQVAR